MECVRCDKELFLSPYLASNAAILYHWFYGKDYGVYECPYRAGDYHLTTNRWWIKRSARVLKPR